MDEAAPKGPITGRQKLISDNVTDQDCLRPTH